MVLKGAGPPGAAASAPTGLNNPEQANIRQ